MDQLIAMARRLGQEIARHERTTLLKKAQDEVDADPETKRLVEQYHQQVEKIHFLEQQQKPVEVDDKHKLAHLEQQISIHPQLANLTRRQADFVEMMHKIKETIDRELQTDR